MKSFGSLIVLCAAAVFSAAALEGQAPSILEPKVERLQGPPLWISAEAVADEEKVVNLDLIGSDFLRSDVEKQKIMLGGHIRADNSQAEEEPLVAVIPAADCRSGMLLTSHGEGEKPSTSLTDLATYSRLIVRGTIRSIDPGFISAVPFSLLSVEVSEIIKGSAPPSLIYISYPIAHFRIGALHFCNAKKGYEPQPGDELLLFDYRGPADSQAILYYPRLEQIFFQSGSGVLILPASLKNTPSLKTARSLDDVVARLHSGNLPEPLEGAR